MDEFPQVFEGALYTVFPTMRARGTEFNREVTQFIHGGQVPAAPEHEAPSLDEVCMFLSRISSASGATNSTAVRQRIARNLVDSATQRLFERMPVAKSVWKNFRFQEFGECDQNAREICEPLVRDLLKQGNLQQIRTHFSEPTGWFQALWAIPTTTTTCMESNPSAQRIAQLCETHGPVRVLMHCGLQAGQGTSTYGHHVMVVLATEKIAIDAKGRLLEPVQSASKDEPGIHVGLIVDGNDLQANELMDAVHDYLRRVHGTSAKPASITGWDLVEIQRELKAKGSQLDIGQLFYRKVNLDAMVAASNSMYDWESQKGPILPNSVEYDPSVKVVKPLIPASVRDGLIELWNKDPRRIEWGPAPLNASQEQEL